MSSSLRSGEVSLRPLRDRRARPSPADDRPGPHDERAIRAYAAVGFRPVGLMRQANRNHAGEWTDALLMDLLAEELVEDDGTAA